MRGHSLSQQHVIPFLCVSKIQLVILVLCMLHVGRAHMGSSMLLRLFCHCITLQQEWHKAEDSLPQCGLPEPDPHCWVAQVSPDLQDDDPVGCWQLNVNLAYLGSTCHVTTSQHDGRFWPRSVLVVVWCSCSVIRRVPEADRSGRITLWATGLPVLACPLLMPCTYLNHRSQHTAACCPLPAVRMSMSQ